MNRHDLDREMLWQFAVSVFPHAQQLSALPGDAGSRQYHRLITGDEQIPTAIVVDSRADHDACQRFHRLTQTLAALGLPVAKIYAQNKRGDCLLLEDLGDVCMDSALQAQAVGTMPVLLDLLGQWQQKTTALKTQLPDYDQHILREELSRLEKWFFPHFLGQALNVADSAAFESASQALIALILQQPQAAVHRDFHCRNLMYAADGRVVMIDYQDALWGAASYDLVSLTRDCYVFYSQSQRLAWEEAFRARYYPETNTADWQQACHAQSLQRHLKILGLFVRLAYQDGKTRYLRYLPQVWADVCWESRALAAQLPFFSMLCQRKHDAVMATFVQKRLIA